MSIEIRWLNHASFRIAGSTVVYVDPWKIGASPGDGQAVVVSHAHFDHCSAEDVRNVLAPSGAVLAPPDVLHKLARKEHALTPGATVELSGVKVTGVPAYNIGKAFHPRANGWLGVVIEMDSVRVYYAGDTDRIPEMAKLSGIDVALLPVGGTYTMNAAEAAKAIGDIKPRIAVPYHFGDIVGSADDGKQFAAQAKCRVHVLKPGQSINIEPAANK